MTPSATARAAATTTRSLMQVSSSRRRPVARWSVRRLVYTSWPRADIGTPDQPCQPRLFAGPLEPSALGRAKLGHDAVAVAAVDRVDELDRPVALVSARALEEERRRLTGDAERRRFLLVRHRRLDRLSSVDDVDLVPMSEQVVERAGEILRRQSGHEALRKVKRLDRHRLPVGHAKALDHEDRLGRRHLQEPAETGAGEDRRHREGAAAGLHPTPAHVVAGGGDGEVLGDLRVLVGPSGCGKSTLLRMIAGLEDATEGTISIDGRDVTELPPRSRDVAMVFQSYALYPHMSVRENLGYGLKVRKTPKKEAAERVARAAKLLGLEEMLDRKPGALSGGQRQRVAMGRAIVREPKAFLMDEPLSNLDAKLRVSMRAELAKLHERLRVTTVYVTHDQVEAMTLGQRVAVLRDGVLQQVDTPHNLFHHPENLFVAAFIGSVDDRRSITASSDIDLAIDHRRMHFFHPATGLALNGKG